MVKSLALRAVAMGIGAPEAQIDRYIELSHLKRLLAQLRINCVVDVGANRGQFARELRGIGYTDHIISFEPVTREFAELESAFSHDSKWRGHKLALGHENTSASINLHPMSTYNSLLPSEQTLPTETIQLRRLDAMFDHIIEHVVEPRVFLKLDTQGFDTQVFRGADGCLSRILGLQSELSIVPIYQGMPHYIEALSLYESAGFALHNLSVVNRVANGGLLELNCFMRRP